MICRFTIPIQPPPGFHLRKAAILSEHWGPPLSAFVVGWADDSEHTGGSRRIFHRNEREQTADLPEDVSILDGIEALANADLGTYLKKSENLRT